MSKVDSTERHDTERTQCGAKPSISISQHEARQGGPTDHQILCTLGFFLLRVLSWRMLRFSILLRYTRLPDITPHHAC